MRPAPWREPACSVAPLQPVPPAWVEDLFAGSTLRHDVTSPVAASVAGPLALFTTTIVDAFSLLAPALRVRVAEAYAQISRAVASAAQHPVRFWNFVPCPNDVMGPGLDRYMVFNAGRYDAYERWHGTADGFGRTLATASAIGVVHADLTIVCLASDTPGSPVENPRQTPSWEYSARYGPRPPCFARATTVRWSDGPRLLIGGTASIVGEDSQHRGDPVQQVEETMTNLAAVIAAARGSVVPTAADLARLNEIRVYLPRSTDAALIESAVRSRCPALGRMEMAVAQLCRPELLVEIEGVAVL